MSTIGTLTNEQLHEVLRYARAIKHTGLASCAMRAIDGDLLYSRELHEVCAAAYADAHESAEFLAANGKLTGDNAYAKDKA